MTLEEKMKVVEVYRDDFKMLCEIVEVAGEIHYRNSNNVDIQSCLGIVIEQANKAIVNLAKEFAEDELLDEGGQQGKLGYSFSWLRKLKGATDDADTEKILKDWLAELAQKK